jgi:hypothetical protein
MIECYPKSLLLSNPILITYLVAFVIIDFYGSEQIAHVNFLECCASAVA